MITVKQLSEIFSKALIHKTYTGTLSNADIQFISLFDDATTIQYIVNALNMVLEGNDLNKYKIPSLIRLVFLICRTFSHAINIPGVNLANVAQFIVYTVMDSGVIPLDEFELIIIREIIEASIILLLTDVPIIKKRFGCFG